jgi:hypothetical protein
VEDLVDRLRRERVEDLAERPEPRVDLLRACADRLADEVGGLVGRDRRERVVDLRRARSSASHERHVDRREGDVVADRLRAHDAGERVERALEAT